MSAVIPYTLLLLASIALEELALAHIMNTEVEKLQFVLGTLTPTTSTFAPTTVSLSNLLAINSSFQRTLRDVIKKEMLLEFKFENVLDLIDTLSPVPPVPPTIIPPTVASFSNPEAIVNTEDVTVPYPSDIVVYGLPGSISNVTVTIHGFVDPGTINSPNPGHLSLLVVSLRGTDVLIYSDAGNSTGAFGTITFTVDDNAATLIPQSDFVSGTFKPSVYKNDFNLNSPAPTGFPYNTALSSFIGQAPNGTWSLSTLLIDMVAMV